MKKVSAPGQAEQECFPTETDDPIQGQGPAGGETEALALTDRFRMTGISWRVGLDEYPSAYGRVARVDNLLGRVLGRRKVWLLNHCGGAAPGRREDVGDIPLGDVHEGLDHPRIELDATARHEPADSFFMRKTFAIATI